MNKLLFFLHFCSNAFYQKHVPVPLGWKCLLLRQTGVSLAAFSVELPSDAGGTEENISELL